MRLGNLSAGLLTAQKRIPVISDHMDIILRAVISVYLYMARNVRFSGIEINLIDRMLRSLFGNEIPLYKIEYARHNIFSLREAANKLNHLLDNADKLRLILSLIALAYHDRDKIHVLGSVEIVELVDLLRLDVNILDGIYDVFESKSNTLALSALEIIESKNPKLLNSMSWGGAGEDYQLAHLSNRYVFIMIEGLVLIAWLGDNPQEVSLISSKKDDILALAPNQFYRINPDYRISFQVGVGGYSLSLENLWQLFHYRFQSEGVNLKGINGGLYRATYQNGMVVVNPLSRGLISKTQRFCIDASPTLLVNREPLALLITMEEQKADNTYFYGDRFIELKDGKPRIVNQAHNAILKLHYHECEWVIQPLRELRIFLNATALEGQRSFCFNSDMLCILDTNYMINRNWELIEIPLKIESFSVHEMYHRFVKDKVVALDGISFTLFQNQMMAIMGPSGSGKTTLLKVLLGELNPDRAVIKIDGSDYIRNFSYYQRHIGYVPQDDLLFANLTVYENLYYNLRLRLPSIQDKLEIRSRIENLLRNVGLYEQRNMTVGDVMHKRLSGGQRRRLNIALELISNPTIIILDEPTSGLSSKDSESIITLLSELKAQGKIIICTIHQPNATIFDRFDRVLLMDKGGSMVYFGDVDAVFDYFDAEYHQLLLIDQAIAQKRDLKMPEYFFDLIEYTDQSGNRRFPPRHWRQKYRDYSFRQAIDIDADDGGEETQTGLFNKLRSSSFISPKTLFSLLSRSLLNKSRSKINVIMTIFVAPVLALFTSLILRNTTSSQGYVFYENKNFLLYMFISVIIFIFIGLANSIDDILSEKRIIQRERKLNISVGAQLQSKYIVLLCMTIVQSILYYFISALVLGIKGSALAVIPWIIASGVIGYKFGIISSASIHDRSAVINLLPLIIIPQIMFSGAVIRFEDMNPALKYSENRQIPEFCHLIPSRWLYEGMALSHYHYNSYQRALTEQLRLYKNQEIDSETRKAKLYKIRKVLDRTDEEKVVNETSYSMIRMAHGDYLRLERNTFFAHTIKLWGKERKTLWINALVIIFISTLLSIATWIKLRFFYE